MINLRFLLVLFFVTQYFHDVTAEDDDFTPTVFSPGADVQLAHKYPHLSTSLQEQDRTFFSNEESTADYAISLVVFPALVSGICLICVCCLCLCLCCRCFLLGCLNCFKCCFRICCKDCCRKTKEEKGKQEEKRQKRYAIYSKTFPFLLVCSFVAIVWVWVGADHLNNGVIETQNGLTFFGDVVQSISDELSDMAVSGRRIDNFLGNNTCPPVVATYLADIESSFEDFTETTSKAAEITGSVEPAIEKANDNLEKYWDTFQEYAFDLSALVLLIVICIYTLGVCMKTAILIRVGLLLTILVSFVLCILVFVETVVIMGYSDFCMAPTHHMERSLKGLALDVVHYYSTCEGEGPLFRPIEDSQTANSLMNTTYISMITAYPNLNEECRTGAAEMEDSFNEISQSSINVVEFARCPYIHEIYSFIMLEGFCADSFSGFYNVHVSHLSTLVVFFTLMVNAAILYPHYKGKTLKHLCCCCYSKEVLEKEDMNTENPPDLFDVVYLNLDSDDDLSSEDGSYEFDDEEVALGAGEVELVEGSHRRGGGHHQYGVSAIEDSPNFYHDDNMGDETSSNTFSFVNPSLSNAPSNAMGMVRVKVDDNEYDEEEEMI